MKNERGFALVLTLLVTALLVALTAEFVDEVYVDSSARANFVDGQQASLLAASGIEGAKKLIQMRLIQQYSSQADLDLLSKVLSIDDENGSIRVRAEEESGKLNINALVTSDGNPNTIFHPIAERLFKKLALAPQLVDALADWISSSDVASANGAKTPYYQALKPPYAAKGAPMDTFEELRLVKGFDGATVERLRPYLTVYPNMAGLPTSINVNTAAKELLASLDDAMTDELAQEIIDRRKITPFVTPTDLGNKITGMSVLAQELGRNFRIPQQMKGSIFRIISQAKVKDTIRIVEAVVNSSGKNLYWREY
ncbi:MAG TPA: type II secretion system minor pseudopilin GspK [Geobacteraceae bacterium]